MTTCITHLISQHTLPNSLHYNKITFKQTPSLSNAVCVKGVNNVCTCAVSALIQQVTWLVITEVWSKSFGLVTEHRHYNTRPIYVSGFYDVQVLFFTECSIVHFLCAMCMLCTHLMLGHHPRPLGYPCAKLHFLWTFHCWASRWRKITYSITHSVTHPAYLICRKPKLSLRNIWSDDRLAPLSVLAAADADLWVVDTVSLSYAVICCRPKQMICWSHQSNDNSTAAQSQLVKVVLHWMVFWFKIPIRQTSGSRQVSIPEHSNTEHDKNWQTLFIGPYQSAHDIFSLGNDQSTVQEHAVEAAATNLEIGIVQSVKQISTTMQLHMK